MKVKVKICGMRSFEAALTAVDADADFLGFNFIPGEKRYIQPKSAKEIIESTKGKVKTVGVFQNNDIDYVNTIVDQLHLDYAQLHGNESAEYVNAVRTSVIKAVHIPKELQYQCDIFLIDREKNMQLYPTHKRTFSIMLAGGLNLQNVEKIVRESKPDVIDVARGIETDGIANIEKIRQFIEISKGVDL